MNADGIKLQVQSMIQEKPSTVLFTLSDDSVLTVTGSTTGTGKSTQYLPDGSQDSARLKLYTIYSDWTEVPPKGSILTVDGTEYRVQDFRVYYMAAVRFDLSDKYESRA